jgi:hypothetical protein
MLIEEAPTKAKQWFAPLLMLSCLLFLYHRESIAQSFTGTILGTLKDATGETSTEEPRLLGDGKPGGLLRGRPMDIAVLTEREKTQVLMLLLTSPSTP